MSSPVFFSIRWKVFKHSPNVIRSKTKWFEPIESEKSRVLVEEFGYRNRTLRCYRRDSIEFAHKRPLNQDLFRCVLLPSAPVRRIQVVH